MARTFQTKTGNVVLLPVTKYQQTAVGVVMTVRYNKQTRNILPNELL